MARATIADIKISSWAAPTAEDMAILESLSEDQYRELLRTEIQEGFASGVTTHTKDDVWAEVQRRIKAKSGTLDAV